MRILFWLLVAIDAAVLLIFFTLGLAAAPSDRSSPLAVALYMLFVPGLVLGIAILLFVRGTSPVARGGGLLLAAAPMLLVLGLRARESALLRGHSDAEGTLVWFRAGPAREIADAITRNDAVAVTALAPTTDLNARGYSGMTLLMFALRRLEQAPRELEPLRALLKAGADPNLAADVLPLEVAIQESRHAGAEPVTMLLAAGANPNTIDQFGVPVFFSGAGVTVPPEVMAALLERGADLTVRDSRGRSIVFHAATNANWRAVLVLLERGADYKEGRSINGETFKDMVESHARVYGDTAGVAEVLAYLKRQGQ